MIIWCWSWDFWKFRDDRFSQDYLANLKIKWVNAIELFCNEHKHLDDILAMPTEYVKDFEYISLHTPKLKKSIDIRSDIKKITEIYKKFGLENIVTHISWIKHFDDEIMSELLKVPISIENEDKDKDFGQTVLEMKEFLWKYPFNLMLDLQHCYTNDNTMKLALDFQEEFKDRIAQYHIAWFIEPNVHYPLFKTKQDIILKSLKYKNKPIIIESSFESEEEVKMEVEYIKNMLKSD